MRDASSNERDGADLRRFLAIVSLIAVFVLALFLRAYWNVDAATQEGEFLLSAGSDPYYHKRAIDYIQANGWDTLIFDPLLNYPYGAFNPNPPLFQWSVAVSGMALAPFFGGDVETATWWAMLWSPAIWGALTVIPTYLIGRDVFNRRTGLIAAFLLGVSTTHIDHTALGAADHDAMLLFFAVFAFWAYIRAIQGFRGDANWVANWRDSASVSSGLSRFFRERRGALGWAVLTGVFIGLVGLVWKGFPYLIGVMFAYAGIQLLVDHWRNKDSTGLWLGTLVAFVVGTVLVVPAYAQSNVLGFLKPVWFLIGAYFVYGLVMVPTRDLPTILVIPAGIAVALLGVLTAFFLVPDVARSLLYNTVYFKQTALYQTIAEAHPADFNTIVFGIGPVAFFFAMFGAVWLLVTASRNPTRASLFMVVWALIAVYMAHSAVRFLFNATPILAILAAWALVLLLDKLEFGSIGKNMQGAPSFFRGVRRALNGWQVTTAVLIALLLVFPSVFLAVDAGVPPSKESEYAEQSEFMRGFMEKRFGAFGQGFLPEYWNDGLKNLSRLDDYGPSSDAIANRPAFLSWWDYGHWAIEIGEHPTVADNFQNGYEYAANFLLAQNETHAVQLLAARSFPLIGKEQSVQLIQQAGVPAEQADGTYEAMVRWQYAPALDLENSTELEALVTEATKNVRLADGSTPYADGVRIRYFATDIRMLPYDLPQTPYIEQSSIFYAPVILAGKNPKDYVELFINAQDQNGLEQLYTEEEFEERARQIQRGTLTPTGQKYEFKQPFFNSMFYRGFVGTPVDAAQPVEGDQLDQALRIPQPGYGLKHWRLSILNDQLRILEYYPGAVLTGKVTEDGRPLQGVTVTAYDDAGNLLWQGLTDAGKAQIRPEDLHVPHDSVQTGADGSYRLILPFNTEGGAVTVRVTDGSVELSNRTLQVSREDANARRAFSMDFTVQKGTVAGTAFYDADDDGQFNATNGDTPVPNLQVTVGGRNVTTDSEGKYTVGNVSAGQREVSVDSADYQVSPFATTAFVRPDTTTTHDVALRLRQVTVSGNVTYDADADGAEGAGDSPAPSVRLSFTPADDSTGRAGQTITTPNGTYEVRLTPGVYTVSGNFTRANVTYEVDTTVTIPRASEGLTQVIDLFLRRRA